MSRFAALLRLWECSDADSRPPGIPGGIDETRSLLSWRKPMNARARMGCGAGLAAVGAILTVGLAGAQMVPVADRRELFVRSVYQNVTVGPTLLTPPVAFAKFDTMIDALAETEDGHADATAYQNSQFFPAAIYAAGTSQGETQGVTSGDYSSYSIAEFRFRLDTCIEYSLDATMDPGDPESGGGIELGAPGLGAKYLDLGVDSGHQSLHGRLSSGVYYLLGRSSVGHSAPFTGGPTYGIIWTCGACSSPLIAQHPSDATVTSGSTMALTVVPTTPSGTLTYQWRRNLSPLANNGHYTGVGTSILTLHNSTVADTGYYDVVLTDGSIIEPSRLAHLTASGTTAVDQAASPSGLFSLQAANPNPSTSSTSFRYATQRPLAVTAAIYDAAGRLVRPLANRMLSGEGVLTWDGRAESGGAAATGIYFLRIRADGQTYVRRFARLQ